MPRLFGALAIAALSAAAPLAAGAEARVTWAEVPLSDSDQSQIATMEARGVWTAGAALYGYDGVLKMKLPALHPWRRTSVVPVGSSMAVAGSESHRPPKRAEYDGMYEWPSAALYEQTGHQTWLRRWTPRVDEPGVTVLQIVPGADGGFSVAGRQSGCVTFGKPKGRFCVDEDLEMRQSQFCYEQGCEVPFSVRYDAAGELLAAQTFAGASGTPVLGPQGELAIYGIFNRSFDLRPPSGGHRVVAGLPDQPVSESTPQGQLTFYGADGRWKWGRAIVGGRKVNIGSAAFSTDDTLWASIETGKSASAPAVVVAGGRKPRTLFEDAASCEALLRVRGAGAMTVALRYCQEGTFDIDGLSRVRPARAGGVFWIPARGNPALTETAVAPKRKITVVDVALPPKERRRRPALVWFRNGRIVWQLESPASATMTDVYDREDGRICVLFLLNTQATWEAAGERVTLGTPQRTTMQVGCFPAPATD